MRQPRLRGEGKNYTHAVSRIVDRQYLLGRTEKERFVEIMRQLENFLGVRVVTFTLMSNHVHLLLEEPDRDSLPKLTKEQLLERLPCLYDESKVQSVANELEHAGALGDHDRYDRILKRYEDRMADISVFMKELKQRFTQWYNRRNNRAGTLWESRFHSVLVEDDPQALMVMAAYIDLNPVRAGMVDKVEDYRWCGYGAAAGGDQTAREGLGRILDASDTVCGETFRADWRETAKLYRLWLHSEGEQIEALPDEGKPGRKGFSRETVEAEEARDGEMSTAEVIRCRVRYFTHGAVLGSAAYVEKIYRANRQHFGTKRTSGARKMKGADWGGLCVIRDLRKEVIIR
jgi:REP element-mobilizing transposase RayT